MRVTFCGFAFADQPIVVTLQTIAPKCKEGNAVRVLPGGWGVVLLLVDNLISAGKQLLPEVAQATTSEGQTLSQVPVGCITKAATGWDQILAVSSTGQLYSCKLPDLELPRNAPEHHPQALLPCTHSWTMHDILQQQVLEVAAGEHHSAALTEDGSVWTWGSNDNCQLGMPVASNHDKHTPVAVAGPAASSDEVMAKGTAVLNSSQQHMGAVACGARHTCSVSCTGQVYCWGWDLHGQCGQGRSTVVVDQPQPVSALGGLKVVGIAAGLAHTVVCTDSGDVYSWGWNSDGQLGLGNDQNRSLPELVAAAVLEDMHIDKVCCGARHTLVKSDQGEAFAWGWNKYGQLGLGDTSNRVLPQQLSTEGSVCDIECGWWHSVVIHTD